MPAIYCLSRDLRRVRSGCQCLACSDPLSHLRCECFRASGLPVRWLIFTRLRCWRGDELRCGKCEYLLHGIESNRCPECGTLIDYQNIARGCRRGRSLRIVVGLGLLIAAFAISESSLRGWSWSIYWYQYKPTSEVMQDLKHGSGSSPPVNNPLERGMFFTHGWLSERVDLARVCWMSY